MQSDRQSTEQASLALGLLLLVFGGLALAVQAFQVDLSFGTWPFYVIVPGVILLIVGLVVGREPGLGLCITGSIVTSTGFVLLYQHSTGHWASWAYAWALVAPGSVGAGMLLAGLVSRRQDWIRGGARALAVGLVLFAIGFVFFEGVIGIGGQRLTVLSNGLLPALFVGLGVILLARGLLGRRRGDSAG